MSDILLDPLIRDNALVPIFCVMLMMNLIRQNLMVLMKDDPKSDLKQMKQNNVLARAKLLKTGGSKFLTDEAFRNRKAYYCKKDAGILTKPPAAKNAMQQMENQDPSQHAGMLKSQMIMILSQGGVGYWVNFLYNGLLVGKTPFPLTYRFKSMFQRGVDVENLEPGYISGLCWYIMIMMSVGQVQGFLLSLLEEGKAADPGGQEEMMQMMMGMPPPGANPLMGGPDMKKMYQQEKDTLEMHYFESNMETVETELWKKWKKRG